MNALRTGLATLAVLWAAGNAWAAEVEVCYDYGCYNHARVVFSAADLDQLKAIIGAADDAVAERARIAEAIGRMYALAGLQSPIWRDRGRNTIDERQVEGSMDCVDHSTNTDTFLRVLGREDALRFHLIGERRHRFAFLVFGEHWTATIAETASGVSYAVDSWFYDPGQPAVVVPLAQWRAGYDPERQLRASR